MCEPSRYTLSRLKGMETLIFTELNRNDIASLHTFPVEGNGNSLPAYGFVFAAGVARYTLSRLKGIETTFQKRTTTS